ncbi:hypothetical protein P7C73_g6681, partial [Tremellales sp. Uapishka_1]
MLALAFPSQPVAGPSTLPPLKRKKRQQPSSSSASTSTYASPSASSYSSSSSSAGGLFEGPSSSSTAYNSTSAIESPSSTDYSTSSYVAPYSSASTSTYSYSPSKSSMTSTISRPWTYSTTRTSSGSTPTPSVYVPGVILNMTLAGDSDTDTVYSVPMDFGHIASSKRDSTTSQTLNMQVDLGSSDLWVASDNCTTSYCKSAPALFDASQSLDSGVNATLAFQEGSVAGDIYWEEIDIGGFGIGYQAFVSADDVENEDLGGGDFSGLLGLALPANSVILDQIPGTTSSNPDGATFLDNLFGSGASAPTERLFTLSLARREDVRTTSLFSIGAISSDLCPSPCSPSYAPIVAQPNLGVIGYLHWRVQVESISATTFSDAQSGQGATTTTISLGASQVDSGKNTPLAVLDSGGVEILVGYRPFVDNIYKAYGVSVSSDGNYYLPCTTQMALTFTIAGQQYPVHPLDMSWAYSGDPSGATCLGAIQYSSTLGDAGDFVLGSSFLKNVYSIFQYPDTNKEVLWQPKVGLISLTNASIASQDFYAVRTLRQSLSSVSAAKQTVSSPTNPNGSAPSSSATPGAVAGKKLISTAGIAAIAVVGFFVLAAGAFCLWWFLLRRKLGKGGKVEYRTSAAGARQHERDLSTSSLRSKKHSSAKRQKSMIEGYSDYEGDSWMTATGTENSDSIRLGYMPEVEEDEDVLVDTPRELSPAREKRNSSPSAHDVLTPGIYPQPTKQTYSMAGPFPSPMRHSQMEMDGFFAVLPSGNGSGGSSRGRR